MSDDICFMRATELAEKIKRRELSAREVMEAHLAQIDRLNPECSDRLVNRDIICKQISEDVPGA